MIRKLTRKVMKDQGIKQVWIGSSIAGNSIFYIEMYHDAVHVFVPLSGVRSTVDKKVFKEWIA